VAGALSQDKLAAAVQEETRMIRITFSDYLSMCRVAGALSQDKLAAAVQEETRMAEQDLTEADRLVAKNSVEEYIYDIRQRLVHPESLCPNLDPTQH
jgi:hypothetical protein